MNIYFFAAILALVDTILSYKYFLKKSKSKFLIVILIFFTSFYLFLLLIKYLVTILNFNLCSQFPLELESFLQSKR